MSEQKNGQKLREGNKNKALIIVCAAIIIALVAVIVVLLLKSHSNTDDAAPKRDVVINNENAEKIVEEMIEQDNQVTERPGTYEVRMNSTWNFQDGASSSDNAYVENSTSNTNAVYFDVQLSDTEETIYESPIIPVGSHLDDIKLDKDLDAGTYDCVLTYHLVDEEQNTLGTLRMALSIVITN